MMRLIAQLVCLLVLYAAHHASAQEVEPASHLARDAEVAEDMQTMAAILLEDIQRLYAFELHIPHTPPHHGTTMPRVGTPLAESLPSYGVVIQMRIPALLSESVAAKKPANPQAHATRWEQTQRKLRGDMPQTGLLASSCFRCHGSGDAADHLCPGFPKQRFTDCTSCHGAAMQRPDSFILQQLLAKKEYTQADYYGLFAFFDHEVSRQPTRTSVIDQVVKTLAENAHNFRHLEPDERVTISLSYERNARSADKSDARSPQEERPPDDQNAGENGQTSQHLQHSRKLLAEWLTQPQAPRKPLPLAAESLALAVSAASGDGLNPHTRELSGDLLMKQGKYEQAAQSYEQAIEASALLNHFSQDTATELHRELLRKLIQVYNALGRREEARRRVLELTGLSDKRAATAATVKSPMDALVLEKLDNLGLKPTSEVSRAEFIRRLTIDLTGLPPTTDEVGAFLKDESPDAYGKLVDQLLGSSEVNQVGTRFLGLGASNQPKETELAVPGRIAISATKLQLDLIGRGEISHEAFLAIADHPRLRSIRLRRSISRTLPQSSTPFG